MKGLGKKVSFLAVVSVLATALLGSAYTLWYEDLVVRAEITTGELDGKIICGIAGDNDDPLANIPGYPYPGKDIGEIVFKDNVDPDGPDDDSNHEYLIEIENAYPGYAIDCEVELFNIGTVPWHIELATVEVYKNGELVDLIKDFSCVGQSCTAGQIDSPPDANGNVWTDPDDDPIFVVFGSQLLGCQIHPDPIFGAATSVKIGVNQSAMEASNYVIIIKFQVNQWNESGWLGCGQDNPNFDGPVLPPALVP